MTSPVIHSLRVRDNTLAAGRGNDFKPSPKEHSGNLSSVETQLATLLSKLFLVPQTAISLSRFHFTQKIASSIKKNYQFKLYLEKVHA